VISVLTTLIGGTPTKLLIKLHASKAGAPKNYLGKSIRNIPIPTRYTNIKIPKKDHGKILFRTSMMGITYSIPSIFQTFSALLFKRNEPQLSEYSF
jgi:hypothetical protein